MTTAHRRGAPPKVHVSDLQAALAWCRTARDLRVTRVDQVGQRLVVSLSRRFRSRCVLRLVAGPGALEVWQPAEPAPPWDPPVTVTCRQHERPFQVI